jgi:hypothetical protein
MISCSKKDTFVPKETVFFDDDFTTGTGSWIAGFADYPAGQETFYELRSFHATLPAPLDQADGAIFISGNNHSDDLFMYLKKEFSGLKPTTSYTAKFIVDVASNAPSGGVGVGGPPGDGVAFGIGVTTIEPLNVLANGYYRLNVDKGNQVNSGPARKVIGTIGNGYDTWRYVLLRKEGTFSFTTDNTGKAWATVSTDSGFEATTSLYYSRISIEFAEN